MDWNPRGKYSFYLNAIDSILGDEPRTVRDVYYALEARGFPEECDEQGYDFKYRYVKRAVKKGRRAGYIDPAVIYDASRQAEATVTTGHGDPESFLQEHVDGVESAYTENFWDDQDHHVEVWLEKQSLATVFEPICDDLNVRLEATRGDWSDSKVFEATQRLIDRLSEGDDVRILYWGDYNPSGLHAPVAIQQTMAHYGMKFRGQDEPDSRYFDIWPFSGALDVREPGNTGSLQFERVGLNTEHVERFDLPENPTPSSTNKDRELRNRFMRHASDGRDVNIELNALKEYHRDFLEERIRESIEQYVDDDARETTEDRIERRQEAIGNAISVDYDEVEDA